MKLHTTIRDSTPEDALQIFDLRCDPRLAGMQYAPTSFEAPTTVFALAQPGSEIPAAGYKCTTILVDQNFAGHITQLFTTGRNRVTNVYLGWNLVPELWGMGIMVRALDLLFDQRFRRKREIEFVACCFATNYRCLRVIEKLGFRADTLTLLERVSHFARTLGRERVMKHRLTFDVWCERHRSQNQATHARSSASSSNQVASLPVLGGSVDDTGNSTAGEIRSTRGDGVNA